MVAPVVPDVYSITQVLSNVSSPSRFANLGTGYRCLASIVHHRVIVVQPCVVVFPHAAQIQINHVAKIRSAGLEPLKLCPLALDHSQ